MIITDVGRQIEFSLFMEQLNISFADIVGNARAKSDLRRLVQKERLPHALLMTGTDGIGKKLIGRALSASVLCEKSVDGAACGKCPECELMIAGQHPDYIEICPEVRGKGAALIRVEQIKSLLQELSRPPARGRKRVVLIDEADKLGEASANSLLKTIEEPAEGTMFIFVTARRSALLTTIRSRCMQISLSPIDKAELKTFLQRMPARNADENLAAVEVIAALAEGSIARALALREDSAAFKEREQVLAVLGELPRLRMERIWELAAELGKLSRDSAERWTIFFLMGLRDLRLLALNKDSELLFHIDKRAELNNLLTELSADKLAELQAIAEDFAARIKSNASLALQFEGVLIRLREAV